MLLLLTKADIFVFPKSDTLIKMLTIFIIGFFIIFVTYTGIQSFIHDLFKPMPNIMLVCIHLEETGYYRKGCLCHVFCKYFNRNKNSSLSSLITKPLTFKHNPSNYFSLLTKNNNINLRLLLYSARMKSLIEPTSNLIKSFTTIGSHIFHEKLHYSFFVLIVSKVPISNVSMLYVLQPSLLCTQPSLIQCCYVVKCMHVL